MDLKIQNPRDLTFMVAQGNALFQLTVLKEKVVNVGDFQVVLRIIGESHWLTVKHDKKEVFHEVLACEKLPNVGYEHAQSLTDGEYAYQAEGYTVKIYSEVVKTVPKPLYGEAMEYAFPETNEEIPITRLSWVSFPNTFVLDTVHSYPTKKGVHEVVRSLSTINLSRITH